MVCQIIMFFIGVKSGDKLSCVVVVVVDQLLIYSVFHVKSSEKLSTGKFVCKYYINFGGN